MKTISQQLASRNHFSVVPGKGIFPYAVADQDGAVYLSFFMESDAQKLADKWNAIEEKKVI